jgi:cell division protein ZapA
MPELIPVNVVIGDRNYRLKIEPADEEMLRKTVKMINDKILEFRNSFAGKDLQDYISMVLLWFATEQTGSTLDIIKEQEFSEGLNSLEIILDKALAGE